MADIVITSVVNTPSEQIVRTNDDNNLTGTNKFGSTTNYTEFATDGTMKAMGNATCYRDELNDLIKTGTNNPSAHIVQDLTEGTLDFKDNCDLNDWAVMNVQINHDWELGSAIYPHIHWFQNSNATPNWLFQYRWQRQLNAKTTAWTNLKANTNAITYVSGTINQISYSLPIEAPTGYGQVSDIVQLRLLRDVNNDSTLFSADAYTGDAEAVSVDIHIKVNQLGSREEYVK